MVVKMSFFGRFFEEFKTQKRHFEINWPFDELFDKFLDEFLWWIFKWRLFFWMKFLKNSVTRWLLEYLLVCLYLILHHCVYCLLKSFLFCSSIIGNFSKKILYCSSHMLIIIILLHSDVSTFNYFLSYTLHPNSYLYLNLGSFFLVKHTSPNGRHTLTLIIDICNTGLYFDFTFTPKKKL